MRRVDQLFWVVTAAVICSAGPACSAVSPFEFSVTMTRDTFLIYEAPSFHARAINVSQSALRHRPLIVASGCIEYDLYSDSKGLVPNNPLHVFLAPSRMASVAPGDTLEGHGSFVTSPGSAYFDSTVKLSALPIGHYRATVRWIFDPNDRTSYLEDRVDFWISAPPTAADSQALEEYLGALQMRRSTAGDDEEKRNLQYTKYLEACERIAVEYAESRYARVPLKDLTSHAVHAFRVGACTEERLLGLSQSFIERYPDDVHSLYLIRKISNGGSDIRRRGFLNEVMESVPGTLAGTLAQRLLAEPEEE